jgi:hypothetical protein
MVMSNSDFRDLPRRRPTNFDYRYGSYDEDDWYEISRIATLQNLMTDSGNLGSHIQMTTQLLLSEDTKY